LKDICVIFLKNNARIIVGPDSRVINREHSSVSLMNPNLDAVKAIPPHYWKMSKGKIVPMNDLEKQVRDHMISSQGIQTKIDAVVNKKMSIKDLFYLLVAPFIFLYNYFKPRKKVVPHDPSEMQELQLKMVEVMVELKRISDINEDMKKVLELSRKHLMAPTPDHSSAAQDAFKEYNLKYNIK